MNINTNNLREIERRCDLIADLCADAGWTDTDTHAICSLECSYALRAAYTLRNAPDNRSNGVKGKK